MERAFVLALALATVHSSLSVDRKFTTPGCWAVSPSNPSPNVDFGLVDAQRQCGAISADSPHGDACLVVQCILARELANGTLVPYNCTPVTGQVSTLANRITFEQWCRDNESLEPSCPSWSGTSDVFGVYIIPYAFDLTSGVQDRTRYSLSGAISRCRELQSGCKAVACDRRPSPTEIAIDPDKATWCTVRRSSKHAQSVQTCMPVSTSTQDAGWVDNFRGWYDVQGCGVCRDFCRWVGNSGSGGNPEARLEFKASWWSCQLAGSSAANTTRGHFSSWPYSKCSTENAVSIKSAPECEYTQGCVDTNAGKRDSTQSDCEFYKGFIPCGLHDDSDFTSSIMCCACGGGVWPAVDDGFVDTFRGWYDVQSCGRCRDYCRWVGNSSSGGDPAARLEKNGSWWSCRLAGSSEAYTPSGHFGSWPYPRCSGQNAVSDAIHSLALETTYRYGETHC